MTKKEDKKTSFFWILTLTAGLIFFMDGCPSEAGEKKNPPPNNVHTIPNPK